MGSSFSGSTQTTESLRTNRIVHPTPGPFPSYINTMLRAYQNPPFSGKIKEEQNIAGLFGARAHKMPESVVEIAYALEDDVFAIAADDSLEAYFHENPLPPLKITLTSAAVTPTNEPPPGGAAPLGTLPPLSMCALRLEAIGLPPRTVEIAPDQVEAMRLEDFMGLLTAQFEGRALAGAPAIGASSVAVTGLVDSAESLHALLRASLTQPVVLQVPLRPLPPTAAKAERKKAKKQKQKERCHAAESQQAAAVQGADTSRPPNAPTGRERIRALVARLAAPVADPSMAAALSEIISLVRGDEKNALLLRRAGVVDPLVRLLNTHPNLPATRPAVAEQLLGAVACLSVGPENAHAFERAGAVAPLVRLLNAHPNLPTTSPGVAEQLLAAICNLSSSVEPAGVAAPLVRLITAHPDLPASQPAVASQLFDTVAHLSDHPETRAAFGRAGVAVPLARHFTAHPELCATSPAVAGNLLAAIAELSLDSKIRAALGRAGVVAPLVRLLTDHSASPVAGKTLLAIANLSMGPENKFFFGQAGIVAPLVGLLTAHPDLPATDPAVAKMLLLTVANLSGNSEISTAFGQAGVAAPLVRLLSHPNLPAISEPFFVALSNLSYENRACFVSAGVAAPLVRLLAHMPITSPGAVEPLLRAIFELSPDPVCRAAFAAALPLLGRFLRFPGVDPELVRNVLGELLAS
ncbi:hypothetical protein PAPYR_4490 [Paratrimastix pyriformis]|uniref:Uncharacterized protein n=1 Tax=Paratrimastix pyriformis TaxID=342808 RepID=A0ABQ8UJN3_9EUKA|nr:hypothetical protein PAPYR_4490 [Paratrimastix pyriformis]